MIDQLESAWDLTAEGYEPHGPGGEAEAIDRRVAEETKCPKCGESLQYQGAIKPGSYRAFAYCDCGYCIEF